MSAIYIRFIVTEWEGKVIEAQFIGKSISGKAKLL